MNRDSAHSRTPENLLQQSDLLYKITAFQYSKHLRDIMVIDVFVCRPGDIVRDVAKEMARKRISSVVVTDEELRPVGIVTERDMVRKVVVDASCSMGGRKIQEIMTPDPVYLAPDDSLFDALSFLSRYSIKHLPIVENDEIVGIVTMRQIMKIRYSEPIVIIGQLQEAKSNEDFKQIKNEMVSLVEEKLSANADPVDLVTMLSLVNASIHKRLLDRILNKMENRPPVDFCCFVTGSHGRKENLLFPDQDFCLILDDYDDIYHDEYDNFFAGVSQQLSDALNEVGFPYCPGHVMATNPQWRMRISDWIKLIIGFFVTPGPYTVRYMTLLFDSAFLYGSSSLFSRYIDQAFSELSKNHNILRQMHEEEEGRHRVPLGLFSAFITEKDKLHKGEIDMKRSGLIFTIEAARILAMKHGIRETSTLRRLQALVKKGVIHSDDSEYFENAYRVILYHTLHAQVENYLNKGANDYYLNPHALSHRNQDMLKEAFKAISRLQELVGSEFGELIL
jgi:CBS domain-containing protein